MKQTNTKTIFDYMTAPIQAPHAHHAHQAFQAPQFLNTIKGVVSRTDIDIENDLRNATRRNTKCACGKYHPKN
jgi:hypothetical protein